MGLALVHFQKLAVKCVRLYFSDESEYEHGNCTLISITNKDYTGLDNIYGAGKTVYELECFETDPFWGWFTISFMILPGVFLWMYILYRYVLDTLWLLNDSLTFFYLTTI